MNKNNCPLPLTTLKFYIKNDIYTKICIDILIFVGFVNIV